MNGEDELQGSGDGTNAASRMTSVAPFTEAELRAVHAEPLPGREAMTTLIWAPAPGAIAAPVDGLIGADDV